MLLADIDYAATVQSPTSSVIIPSQSTARLYSTAASQSLAAMKQIV